MPPASHTHHLLRMGMKKAFTLLELILVITLLAIMIGLAALYYQTAQVRADANTQAAILVSYFRLAQSNAMAGNENESYGIHLGTDSYVFFEGSTYVQDADSNIELELPPTLTLQNIVLNGDGSDVIFTPPQGETDDYGSLEIFSSQINKTISITITSLGTIRY